MHGLGERRNPGRVCGQLLGKYSVYFLATLFLCVYPMVEITTSNFPMPTYIYKYPPIPLDQTENRSTEASSLVTPKCIAAACRTGCSEARRFYIIVQWSEAREGEGLPPPPFHSQDPSPATTTVVGAGEDKNITDFFGFAYSRGQLSGGFPANPGTGPLS